MVVPVVFPNLRLKSMLFETIYEASSLPLKKLRNRRSVFPYFARKPPFVSVILLMALMLNARTRRILSFDYSIIANNRIANFFLPLQRQCDESV